MSLFDLLDGPSAGQGHDGATAVPSISVTGTAPTFAASFTTPPAATIDAALEKYDAGFAPSSTAPVSSALSHATNIFSLEPVELDTQGAAMSAVAVANNVLFLALEAPARVLRIPLASPQNIDEIELELPKRPSSPVVIRAIYVDPHGRHALLVGDDVTLYLGVNKRARYIPKLKGIFVTSVAWNKDAGSESTSTGSILIGAADGSVFEVIFDHLEDEPKGFFSRKSSTDPTKYCKLIAQLPEPPQSLFLDAFPTEANKYVLLVTARNRVYQYIAQLRSTEPGAFEQLFESPSSIASSLGSLNVGKQRPPWSMDFAGQRVGIGTPGAITSVAVPIYAGQQVGTATSFTWLADAGVYHARIALGSQSFGDSVFDQPGLFPLADSVVTGDLAAGNPSAIVRLRFHYLVFGQHGVVAYSSLTDLASDDETGSRATPPLDVVWEQQVLDELVGVSHDCINSTVWLVTRKCLYEVVIRNEDRDIWKFYMARNKFETAMSYTKNKEEKDLVAKAQADFYFASKRYKLSAQYYAKASLVPFEEVSLRFIECNEMEALRLYISLLLESKAKKGKDAVETTMLAMWLFELNLQNLNEAQPNELEQSVLEKDMKSFIGKYSGHLDKRTVRQLCTNYNRPKELLYFYRSTGDHRNVLKYWLDREEWASAFAVLERQVDPAIFYEFVPAILEHEPAKVVHLLVTLGSKLDPTQLIPTFIKGPANIQGDLIKYLEFCVTKLGRTDDVIHNYLVQLYAKCLDDEDALLRFLKSKPQHYSLDLAIRACHQYQRMEACIYLFTELNLVSESIRLSLQHGDVDHAMELAADASEDAMRENWLSIFEYLVQRGEYKRVMELVRSSSVIKLDDVLPLFPDFCTMDDFKNELVAVLEDYSTKLHQIESDMESSYRSLQQIKDRAAKSLHVTFTPRDPCAVCRLPLFAPAPTPAPAMAAGPRSRAADLADSRSRADSTKSGRSNGGLVGMVLGGVGMMGTSPTQSAASVGPGSTAVAARGLGAVQQQPMPQQQTQQRGLLAFGCGHVVHAAPCARAGADCPVCGDCMLNDLEKPFHDLLDGSWSIV
ncbi:hypothetical protein GGF32_000038 [Allomyces javanicus]|nr:hypothetical protein GGF32_000038 [Allomyces javanicus]